MCEANGGDAMLPGSISACIGVAITFALPSTSVIL
jgi:hypothetical protein